jgi:hypothetical protein
MNPAALNLIVGHTITTLPDSFAQRKELLIAVLDVIAPDHPQRIAVGEMLHWLVAHEQYQLTLGADFGKSNPPAHDGDGQPNGEPQ